MFARMTFLQVKPETIDEGVRIFRTSVFPAAKRQRGFRGACLLVDRGTGKGVAVTFWGSRKDLSATEENRHYQDQLLKGLHLYVGPPIREDYEVVIHNLGPAAKEPARRRVLRKIKPKK